MEIAQMAARLGLPEEKVAMMMQMVRQNGMPESQMGAMMRMATSKGLTPDEIAETLHSLGVSGQVIARVMIANAIVPEKDAHVIAARIDPDFAPPHDVPAADNPAAPATGANAAGSGLAAPEPAPGSGPAPEPAPGSSEPAKVPWSKRFDWPEIAKKAGVIVFWLVAWELLDRIVDNRLLLAGPIRTLEALAEELVKTNFWAICAASFGRIALGFFLALVLGFLFALLSYKSKAIRRFVDPIVSLLKTIPMASFVILLLIWVGTQALTVYLAFLIVVPIIYTNVLTGFESASPSMLEMARVYRLSTWRTFMYVYRPAFMPFLYSSCKLSLGMSWKAGIMAEVLAVPALSIGKEMFTARTFLDTPALLAWTVVVMLLSMLFERIVLWVLKRAQRPCGGYLGVSGAQGDPISHGAPAHGSHLIVSDLNKRFGDNTVLDACSFELEPGQVSCLMAPSGSGKTTLFRVMLGLERADSGSVQGVKPGHVSMMFQEDRLCETLTPVENVALVMPARTSRAAVRALLEEVLPASCMDQPVMELSGGMRRRVSLVRAVAYPGDLAILDEPFTGLDNMSRLKVIDFILRHKGARTFLVATHGEDDARYLGASRMNLAELNGGAR